MLMPAAFAQQRTIDTLELDKRARILRRTTVSIPPPSNGSPVGMVGDDIVVPDRGYVGIDWAAPRDCKVTLVLVPASQRDHVPSGRVPDAELLLRFDIKGPETAGQNALVNRGDYYLAFLNRTRSPVRLEYRTSFLSF
jgi:hypothetical protein